MQKERPLRQAQPKATWANGISKIISLRERNVTWSGSQGGAVEGFGPLEMKCGESAESKAECETSKIR